MLGGRLRLGSGGLSRLHGGGLSRLYGGLGSLKLSGQCLCFRWWGVNKLNVCELRRLDDQWWLYGLNCRGLRGLGCRAGSWGPSGLDWWLYCWSLDVWSRWKLRGMCGWCCFRSGYRIVLQWVHIEVHVKAEGVVIN